MPRFRLILCLVLAATVLAPCRAALAGMLGSAVSDLALATEQGEGNSLPADDAPRDQAPADAEEPEPEADEAMIASGTGSVDRLGVRACQPPTNLRAQDEERALVPPPRSC